MPPELKVGYFEAAESAIDGLDPNPESLKLQAEVFYNLARYDECIECLGKLPKPDSALLEKAKTRLVEQQTGAYDFRSIFAELPTLNPPTVNRATYIGPVDIRVSPGKGRGLFTTRAVEAGNSSCARRRSHIASSTSPRRQRCTRPNSTWSSTPRRKASSSGP
ncbi:hypothetical protein VC83_02165 [Pseudogymnoascus destructans]|uniref:Uncharacterized protein n=1 Tax=Pseudogymnoascus destructans TaxID=655981 RepID=A0A177AJ48_9PEZI|nr:uncharacterized protein VC83_02165 [Pseudogymnoascus destructans]OAF61303.1 hypothetical protein VC83_02165 [Pseudogymnoascus destructans]